MSQRHANDTIARLWEGAADPKSPRFVPVELRDQVADVPGDIEQKFRRDLYTTKQINKGADILNPADNSADLETAVVWKKIDWARRQLNTERANAERAARDAAMYTCQCCGEVVPLGPIDVRASTQRRQFCDGTAVNFICGSCAPVFESLAAERLATEQINGKSRRDRARAILNGAKP